MKRLTTCIFLLCWVSCSLALSLRPDAPSRYVVKPGDTLWDIAHTFLEKPWEWEQLWNNNPQLPDPNRIYPGAVLEIQRTADNSYLKLTSHGTRVLVPEVEKQPAFNPIPPVELTLVRPFLNQNQVYSGDLLPTAPYVVGFSDTHLAVSNDDHIYVKDLRGYPNQNFAIFREDGRFYDVQHRTILGYNAAFIANAMMVKPGNPSILVVLNANRPVQKGDRIMPVPRENTGMLYYPHPPHNKIIGSIIHLAEGIDQSGAHQVVVIDKGTAEGVNNGSVLSIIEEGQVIIDPVFHDQKVKMPNEVTGELMVFRAFDHVSYALIMESVRPTKIGDLVHNPS